MTETGQEGVRFSLNYISHAELLPDSKRMRRRLAVVFCNHVDGSELLELIHSELGIELPVYSPSRPSSWTEAIEKADLRDVLDTITLVAQMVRGDDEYPACMRYEEYRDLIAVFGRILKEEHVQYRIDDLGGIHFSIDLAYEQNRISVIQGLSDQRYGSVRQSIDDASTSLDDIPPDGKGAIRHIFSANECLFRLIFPNAKRLGTKELQAHLKPLIDSRYSGQSPTLAVAHKQLAQYVEWVAGAHFYRHEQGAEEPTQPPLEMAVHFVSTGTSWLRWLRTFDQT